jgi:transcriptional regulator with GAF, ATPase, and Fis domain
MAALAQVNHRYQVISPLGEGADGSVFLVQDQATRERLALKLVRGLHGAGARLTAEFRRLTELAHPRLVRVHDLDRVAEAGPGFPAGTLFFTADYVEGVDPVAAVAAAPESERAALVLTIAEDIAAALAHIHAAGWLHCDVKTGNVVVAREPTRAVLLDLGLSALRGVAGHPRGTLRYMAPESLRGEPEPRSDLFALGVTLYHAISGKRPFAGEETTHIIGAICDGQAPPLRVSWCPDELSEVVERLIRADPSARPSSASVLLDELARVREALGVEAGRSSWRVERSNSLLAPPLIGREEQVATLDRALSKLAHRAPDAPALIRLRGAPGSGRRTLALHAVRRHQLAAAAGRVPPIEVIRGDADTLANALEVSPAGDGPGSLERWIDDLIGAAARRATRSPLALVADHRDERITGLTRAFAAEHPGLRDRAVLLIVPDPGDDAGLAPGVLDVAVPALAGDEVAALVTGMVGRAVDRAWTDALARKCAGLPRFVVEAVRAAATAAGPDHIEERAPDELIGDGGNDALAALVVQRVAALPAAIAGVAEAVAVCGGEATVEELGVVLDLDETDVLGRIRELRRTGLLDELGNDRFALPSRLHSRAIHEAIPEARCKALHRQALAWVEAGPANPVARARHLRITGPVKAAAQACGEAAALLRARGRTRAALAHSRAAAGLASGKAAARAHVDLATDATTIGEYGEAIAAAERAARSRDKQIRADARLALARAWQKSGDYDSAEAALRRLASDDDAAEEARGAYARLLVTRGQHQQASDAAGEPETEKPRKGPLTRGRALRLEAATLARMYLGELARAQVAAERLEAGARAADDRSLLARALGLRGLLSQSSGDVLRAAGLYAAAGSEARAAGDIHVAAVYDVNRATVHMDRGRYGRALEALDSAVVGLSRVGNVAELAPALINRANSLLFLGELAAARRTVDRASHLADDHGAALHRVFARLIDGDIHRRQGQLDRAGACYREALDLASKAGSQRDEMLARIAMAELLAERGDPEALAVLEAAGGDALSDEDRDRWTLSNARVRLALDADLDGTSNALADAAARLADARADDLAWRAHWLAARVALARGDRPRAAESVRASRGILAEILADTPESHRNGLMAHPDVQALRSLENELDTVSAPTVPSFPRAGRSTRQLRRLLALSRRLNSELRLTPLLDQVIDTLIEMTDAERGFLLLFEDGGSRLEVVVARNFDQSTLAGDDIEVSRSIAEKAARSGDVVLAVDAALDQRFDEAASVAAMRLRSVLALPLRQKGRITGTIYLDHRFRRGAFDDEAVELVRELADIAAVAIENARLAEENRRKQEEIAALNRRLEQEVVEKEAELVSVRAKLPERDGLRHAYESIVGRSPAMIEMLDTLDRATDTDYPVVIQGESGTGKELVARALHDNGHRREATFVPINCGAVPEQLLESELFGHTRGSFTGADRNRRGLFEVADGGTLFLDEVADTSLAMQAKLLRVLQEGEVRRIGEERVRRVDVRVVAASNKSLRDMVAEGTFREDLFYRLSVLNIRVPPLRERVEDMSELAEHILDRLTGDGPTPSLTKAALARLCGYDWPGNVRELENELARASALGDSVIDVDDLSARVARATPRQRTTRGDDLRIKPQVESLERTLVESAMERTNGNQTAAAKLLGLSRYGLQKKLKRYGIAR